jgi:DNA repair photolyase
MALNKSKGNMYEFVTHTWNTVKGKCPHDCGYCYMKGIAKRFNKQQCPAHFDESELKTNLGQGNFIFVGSSNDLFAEAAPVPWIMKTLEHCNHFANKYLFQTKNPKRMLDFIEHPVFKHSVGCTTIESDCRYVAMGYSPSPDDRAAAMANISKYMPTYVTVEPIMDFDLGSMVKLVKQCRPVQVNIGADTGHNELPEPPKEKVLELIAALEEFTTVKQKSNLKRIFK